jgi:nucleotide-binding universal stress UspA family protein
MYRSIVVGSDNSKRASRAVDHAAGLALTNRAALHVVCAVGTPVPTSATHDSAGLAEYETRVEHLIDAARSSVEAMAGDYRRRGVSLTTHVHCGDATHALIGVASEVDADLIVVGNKGLNGLRRLLGSVPAHVSRRAPMSVLIVNTAVAPTESELESDHDMAASTL